MDQPLAIDLLLRRYEAPAVYPSCVSLPVPPFRKEVNAMTDLEIMVEQLRLAATAFDKQDCHTLGGVCRDAGARLTQLHAALEQVVKRTPYITRSTGLLLPPRQVPPARRHLPTNTVDG
jgi:hypothetical protein